MEEKLLNQSECEFDNRIIQALPNDVLVADMYFGEKLVNGIVIMGDDKVERGIRPRWAKVYAVGKKHQHNFKKGQWILIKHGRWSRGMMDQFDEADLRKVDPNDILLVTDQNMDERI